MSSRLALDRRVFVTPYWDVFAPQKLAGWIDAPHIDGAPLDGRKHRKQIREREARISAALDVLSEVAWELNLDAQDVESGLKAIFGK